MHEVITSSVQCYDGIWVLISSVITRFLQILTTSGNMKCVHTSGYWYQDGVGVDGFTIC